jgi:hypothetical protein
MLVDSVKSVAITEHFYKYIGLIRSPLDLKCQLSRCNIQRVRDLR